LGWVGRRAARRSGLHRRLAARLSQSGWPAWSEQPGGGSSPMLGGSWDPVAAHCVGCGLRTLSQGRVSSKVCSGSKVLLCRAGYNFSCGQHFRRCPQAGARAALGEVAVRGLQPAAGTCACSVSVQLACKSVGASLLPAEVACLAGLCFAGPRSLPRPHLVGR
jgi:hypothetical protein